MDTSDDSEPLLVDDGGDDDEGGAPPSLLCPITQEVMVEPVIASDGFTYERSAIERWLDMGADRRSPTTNAPLPSRTLVPNRHLASMIAAYRSRLGARVVALVGAERELPAPADWESRERALLGEVARLLDAGADPDARDDGGRPALLAACSTRRFPAARALVEAGARVSAPDGSSEALNIIEALIEREADRRAGRSRRKHLGKLLEDPDSDAGDVENPLREDQGLAADDDKGLSDDQLDALRALVGALRDRAAAEVADDERRAARRRDADARRATDEEARDSQGALRRLADRPGDAAAAVPAGVFGAARLRQRGYFPSLFALQFGLVPDRRRGPGRFKWTCFAFLEEPAVQSATHRERVAMRRMRAGILSVGTLLFFFLCFG